jgi:hypothetical protein
MVVTMVDIIGATALGWAIAATPEDNLLYQSRSYQKGEYMRSVNARCEPWGSDNPHIRHDFRGGVGVVLSMGSQTHERPFGQARSEARKAVQPIPRHSDEGPLGRLWHGITGKTRLCALERKMDALAEAMEMWK